jgi:hypothetical protein
VTRALIVLGATAAFILIPAKPAQAPTLVTSASATASPTAPQPWAVEPPPVVVPPPTTRITTTIAVVGAVAGLLGLTLLLASAVKERNRS